MYSKVAFLSSLHYPHFESAKCSKEPAYHIVNDMHHLCTLPLLPEDGFTFSAIPPKMKGVGTFPVKAMAKLK